MVESPRNRWRQETSGEAGWAESVRPGAPDKLLMISSDCHANEPARYLADYIETEYQRRIPRLEVRDDGSEWAVNEGARPQLIKPSRDAMARATGDDRFFGTRMEPEDILRNGAGRTIEDRLAEQRADGVDIELIFPNKGLMCWATPDPEFADAMCRAWNRWAYDFHGGADGWNEGRTLPLACVATGDVECALRSVLWAAEHGFVGLCLGNTPIYGPKVWGNIEYNDPAFEVLWSTIEETGLPVTFHVSTGRDPRAVGGSGGAIVNYVCHSMETTIEPLVQLIASGVFERHPGVRAGLVESGIGFVPWLLETMDHAYRAHHFWVRPMTAELPSTYFRRQCFATFQEDHAGLDTAEHCDLVDNYLWANDYPHHEGSWPHSAASIERQMANLSEESRAKILGLNAQRIFGL
jgi:Amidohydrolase